MVVALVIAAVFYFALGDVLITALTEIVGNKEEAKKVLKGVVICILRIAIVISDLQNEKSAGLCRSADFQFVGADAHIGPPHRIPYNLSLRGRKAPVANRISRLPNKNGPRWKSSAGGLFQLLIRWTRCSSTPAVRRPAR